MDDSPLDVAMYKIRVEMALTNDFDMMLANIKVIVKEYGILAYQEGQASESL